MNDLAIVGGGLAGLSIAKLLEQRGLDYTLFEARNRLGGRVLSHSCRVSAIPVDLGPTWYWPQTQPAIAKLISDLGLLTFPQQDDGTVWVLTDPNQKPKKLVNERIHGGARRIEGGMTGLIDAVAAGVPADRVGLSHVLTTLHDRKTHVEMQFQTPHGEVVKTARRVILAIPPRLIEEHILFVPVLPEKVQRALLARPTWMAQQAKAVVVYGDADGDAADFRSKVGSGNAFVHHEQAVLTEVYDASDMGGRRTALGGFLALPPSERARFRDGIGMLITSQFVQLFGPEFESGTLHYQDWACERYTCASLDRYQDVADADPHAGDPQLRSQLWDGRLRFAGTEFAERQAGYLEGALVDAERAVNELNP
jgi:monoamine oxidase